MSAFLEEYTDGALYIRVSTDKQEELSPDAQKRLLLDYAKKHKILIKDEHIFIENGISGRNARKRPEFPFAGGICGGFASMRLRGGEVPPPDNGHRGSVRGGETGRVRSAGVKTKP